MSVSLSELKIRLPTKLKQQFQGNCNQLLTNMTGRIHEFVKADMDGRLIISDQGKSAFKPKTDPLKEQLNSLSDSWRHLEKSLAGIEHKQRELIDRGIPDTQNDSDQLAAVYEMISQELEETRAGLSNDIRSTKQAIDEIRPVSKAPLDRKIAIASLSFAFASGIFLPILFLALLPSHWSLTHFIARETVGADTHLEAAHMLAGKGDIYLGLLQMATQTLANQPDFRISYANCIVKAQKSKKPFDCKVTFVPIKVRP